MGASSFPRPSPPVNLNRKEEVQVEQKRTTSSHGTSHVRVQNKGYSHGGASYTKKALKGFTVESGAPSEDINANKIGRAHV